MSDTAFMLIAHGARETAWAHPLRRIRDSVADGAPGVRVELAFMELMSPDIAECTRQLVAEGVRAIRVVPLFIARGGHLVRDVPEQLEALRALYPGVDLRLLGPVGEAESVMRAMAEHVLDLVAEAKS